jgi:hypothetical protein
MKLHYVEQGSDAWHELRRGRITMSHAKDLITGGAGKTRMSYLLEVVAGRLGIVRDNYQSMDMVRGSFMEDYAIQAFEAETGFKVDRIGFVEFDDARTGSSPDGHIGAENTVVEVKCPDVKRHVKNILGDGYDEYKPQLQGSIAGMKAQNGILISYCPMLAEMPLHFLHVSRDVGLGEKIMDAACNGADFVDASVKAILDMPTKQEVLGISRHALKMWEQFNAQNSEVAL